MGMRSPIRLVAAGLLAGTVTGFADVSLWTALAVIALAGLVALALLRHRPRDRWTIAAALAAALLGVVQGRSASNGPLPLDAEELTSTTGVVTQAADFNDAPASADDPSEREAVFRACVGEPGALIAVRLTFHEGDDVPALLPGDRVRLVGSAEPVRRPSNPGESDRRAELRRAGVAGEFRVGSPAAATQLGIASLGLTMRVRRWGEIARRRLLERLRDACGGPGPAPALLGCLLFGDRSGLDQATSDAFRDSGTAHLLSVSGLHVVLLAEAARRLARRLVPRRTRRRFALPSLVILLFAYCALCRFVTPVVRAAVFLAVAQTARATGRRPSPLDTLAVAAALVIAVEPAQILDPSFQLSFAAVVGLALFTRGLRTALFPALALYRKFPGAIPARRLWILERFATAISTSLAASVATAPIVARVFGRLQPAAPISNLAAVPLAAVLMPLAAALAILGGTISWLTAPLAAAAVAPLRVVTDLTSRMPGATIESGSPPVALLVVSVALLVAAAILIVPRPRMGTALAAASWLALAAAPIVRSAPQAAEFIALDVGHGLCVLARSGESGDVLFDAGGHSPGVGRHTIVPALRALGVRRLGAVFLSHEDSDHCSALAQVLGAVSVGEVVVSPGFGADRLPASIVALCRAHAVPVTVVARGDAWTRRGITARVLSPSADVQAPSDNDASIVAHVTLGVGDDRLIGLIPGDVEGGTLHALACDPTAPAARVLLLPHHGRGDRASHAALARRLGATVLIASTSASAPMSVPGALVTGIDGAIRVRRGEDPAPFPWPER